MMLRLFWAVLAGLSVSLPALADIYDEAEIEISTYGVSGGSLAEVQDQMQADGPEGFWAYTTWDATWTGDCETTVTAQITMPELSDDADLTDAQIDEFDRMNAALLDHELGHVQIGLDFADAVAAADCPVNTDDILAEYVQAGIDYDAETEHGLHQGVTLVEP